MDDGVKTREVRRAAPKAGKAVTSELARLATACGAMDPKLVAAWQDVVGAELSALCQPVRMKKTGRTLSLVVRAPHGAAATRITFSQEMILARARQILGAPHLKRLIVEQRGAAPAGTSGAAPGGRWRSQKLTGPPPAAPEPAPPPATSVQEALERLCALVRKP